MTKVLDDIVLVQPSSPAYVGAGAGDDIYIISPHMIGGGGPQNITITDNEGENVLQLVEGLTISSSKLAGDFLQLTLSDGSEITVSGASTFTYEIAGNSAAGVAGVKQDFATFVAETLQTTIPADGEISEGVADIVIGTTPTPDPDPDPEPDPEPEPIPGATLNLVKGAEVVAPLAEDQDPVDGVQYTTAGNDVISGVVHPASSKRTLDSKDVIDGGDGDDTLVVDMQSNFSGFSGEGKLINVETVELNNAGTSARYFSGKGAEGVQVWDINGLVSLKDAASGAVNLSGVAGGKSVKLEFVNPTTLDLGVDGVGKAGNLATVNTVHVSEVNLAVNNASALNLADVTKVAVSGAGDLELAGANLESVTASGEGALTFTAGASLQEFNGSEATGDIVLDATAATANISTGSGKDRITVDMDMLPVNVAIDGGEGWDTLIVKGTHDRTIQPTLTGIEYLRYDGSAKLTVSADNIDSLESVNMASSGELVLAGLSGDLNLTLNGNGTLISDHSGVTQLKVDQVSSADVTLTNTASLDVQINKDFTGSIKAPGEITSLEVKVNDASFSPTLEIGKLEILTLTGNGSADLSSLKTAPALEVNAENLLGDLTLGGTDGVAADTLTVVGSRLGTNEISIDSVTNLIVTGGIQNDTVHFKTVPAVAADGIFELNLGEVSTGDTVIFDKITDLDAFQSVVGKMQGVDNVQVHTLELAASEFLDKDGNAAAAGTGVVVNGPLNLSTDMSTVVAGKAIFNLQGTGDVAAGKGADAAAVLAKIFGDETSNARGTGYAEIAKAKFMFIVDDGTDAYLWQFESADTKADTGDLKLLGTLEGVTDFTAVDLV